MEIRLKNRVISPDVYPFMVAEIGANHMGDFDIFMRTVESAISSGADGIKLQTYTPESMTLDCDTEWFIIKDGPWAGKKLWDLYKEGSLPREWHYKAFEYCARRRVECFSTPFSPSDVDFLETLKCPIYKVASFELTHTPLLKHLKKTGKPVILSTGMAALGEISFAESHFTKDVILLHCTSAYPTPDHEANTGRIKRLNTVFPNNMIGYSDHTLGYIAAMGAVAQGAVMIEKHFTLDKKHGLDAKFSMTPIEFRSFVDECMTMYETVKPPTRNSQEKSKKFRRSIFTSKDIAKGDCFTDDNICIIRPSDGIEPDNYYKLVGEQIEKVHTGQHSEDFSVFYRRAAFDIKKGHPITHDLIDPPIKKP